MLQACCRLVGTFLHSLPPGPQAGHRCAQASERRRIPQGPGTMYRLRKHRPGYRDSTDFKLACATHCGLARSRGGGIDWMHPPLPISLPMSERPTPWPHAPRTNSASAAPISSLPAPTSSSTISPARSACASCIVTCSPSRATSAGTSKLGLSSPRNQYPWCSAAWFERTASPAMVKSIYRFKFDRVTVYDEFAPDAAGSRKAKAAHDCRTPKPAAPRRVAGNAKRLGVRQSSAAFSKTRGPTPRRRQREASWSAAVLCRFFARAKGTGNSEPPHQCLSEPIYYLHLRWSRPGSICGFPFPERGSSASPEERAFSRFFSCKPVQPPVQSCRPSEVLAGKCWS